MIRIDGSVGEGGGQILRTSLSLSLVTGTPVRLTNVRANRSNPGLAPQHLTAVNAAAEISSATVKGNEIESTELVFRPEDQPEGGNYEFDVSRYHPSSSAGSVLLVLQTVLVPLTFASEDSTLRLYGGTHVEWSPPFHYVKNVYKPVVEAIGYQFEPKLERWGFYPRGEGLVKAEINGLGSSFRGTNLQRMDRGQLVELEGISAVANLDPDILHRQTQEANQQLQEAGFSATVESIAAESPGPGTVVFLTARYRNITAGFSAFGRKGKRAETVAGEAVSKFLKYHEINEPVDRHLADQLIVPLVAGQCGATYRTERVTDHLTTNVAIARKFTDTEITVDGEPGESGEVTVHPRGD